MPVLTSMLTALIMLLHSILGCCWHHGHVEHDPHADAMTADGGHAIARFTGPIADSPLHVDVAPSHDGCDETACTYLKPRRTPVDFSLDAALPSSIMATCAAISDAFSTCRPLDAAVLADAAPPMRARTSVWLL